MDTMISADEMQVLFDALPDVVFFVKDNESRYTHLNLTLVQRLGRKHRSEVIGKSTVEVFPLPLGGNYLMQDRRVLHGEVIENQLEVHLFPNRTPGWCLTFKRPLCHQNEVVGVVGISRDLGQPDSRHSAYERLNRALKYMQAHHGENLRIKTLADLAGVSVAQLERHFRRVFQLTPQQLLTKMRIESAMRLLQDDKSIAAIGQLCGFADQSAFARQFKATVGMTPRDFRTLARQP
ncbi:AraC family transcriptional regulator [Pseudoxanthomonas sacheonensis]|uniref:AraC-like DNA-binding protein n=1 Tax=Pseudoxanthomonas sacheonensis TaxID=443615 RepID=A0ABU1RTI9_9GAMM|nr:AraC family transcriptional regulator [Pseudoxanthomonas sacheonensis]MDR6842096.1 AraC-like DNA-binding protein [Pseudoxanthomonas sacheonensis]